MAEFQMVAKELERMCNTYHAVNGKCGTDECPLYYEDLCYAQAMIHVHGNDACKLEQVVMTWAAEHPKLVYPTWGEYLCNIGLIARFTNAVEMGQRLFDSPISADIAERLEIQPKEE